MFLINLEFSFPVPSARTLPPPKKKVTSCLSCMVGVHTMGNKEEVYE